MPLYDFIPDEIYEQLSDDPAEQFGTLLKVARLKLQENSRGKSESQVNSIKLAFMSQVNVIVKELGFGEVPVPGGTPISDNEWTKFESALTAIGTRIRLKRLTPDRSVSIELGRVTKFRILKEVERLRGLVKESDLPVRKRDEVLAKLDDLEQEINRQRLGFAKLAAIFASVAGVLGRSSAALANGPEAIQTIGRILEWVGQEKDIEEEEFKLLQAPVKALPAPLDTNPHKGDE